MYINSVCVVCHLKSFIDSTYRRQCLNLNELSKDKEFAKVLFQLIKEKYDDPGSIEIVETFETLWCENAAYE